MTSTSSAPSKTKALLFGGIALLVLIIGIVSSLLLLREPQDTRQQAALEGGTAQVKITPTTSILSANETTTATVSFTTEGTIINGITVRLKFPFTGTTSPLTISDLTIEPTLEAAGNFSCTIKTVNTQTSPATIDVGCPKTIGYKNTTFTNLFSFKLTAGPNGTDTPVTFTFDPLATIVSVAGQDIAAIPTTNLVVTLPTPPATPQNKMDVLSSAHCNPPEVTISAVLTNDQDNPLTDKNVAFIFNGQTKQIITDADGEAAVVFPYQDAGDYPLIVKAEGFTQQTSTISISACAAPTPTPTGTPSPVPTPTPTDATYLTASCNQACVTSSDCIYGLDCYAGVCRSASCQSDSTCVCDTVDVASASGATQLPTTGSLDRTLALLLIGGLLTLGGVQILVGRSTYSENDAS